MKPRTVTFQFVPTYDIDIAWSYQHKGFWRNAGGLLRALLNFQGRSASERIAVLRGKMKDPFDAYQWMDQLHQANHLKPYYFFLVPEERGKYDKNIDPRKVAMQKLIQHHFYKYPLGIHPSWISGDKPRLLKKEIGCLEKITGQSIQSSRQHYIRLQLPDTYRRLLEAGIRYDFSMGYGGINGFRASVASPFYWYDLAAEQQTSLLLFPFCFMDANSCFGQKQDPARTAEELETYLRAVQSVNGLLITIWHNSFLGTDRQLAGWRNIYEEFVKKVPTQPSF